ncbi:MAG: DUF1501 domain-containing protein [Acidobacteriota bacterium]|nr:DUF1501 domain-containing protein [Acidobacteriota bacterium]
MAQTRRDFLRQSACGALSAAAFASGLQRFGMVNSYAQGESYKALVCIFLSGGNDANNMVIPYDDYASYDAIRSTPTDIRIPQDSLLQITPPSDGRRFGLHPNLTGLHNLWGAGKLAILINAGTMVRPMTRAEYTSFPAERPLQLFSHSDQVTQWQTTRSDGPSSTGWGGRTADRLGSTGPFPQITSVAGVNIFNRGNQTSPLVIAAHPTPLNQTLNRRGFDASAASTERRGAMDYLRTIDNDNLLVQASSNVTQRALDVSQLLSMNPVIAGFPATSLGNQLYQIAKLIQLRTSFGINRQIFFASLGGFDTHSGQLAGQGNLLGQVSAAITAFYNFTVDEQLADQVTQFTLSDFGRTCHPSTGIGSDHGWASHHLILGGAVRGGDFYGTANPGIGQSVYPVLALGGPYDTPGGGGPGGLGRGRWLPTTSVDQYGATLAKWYGVPPADIPLVFPNINRSSGGGPQDLGFLNS